MIRTERFNLRLLPSEDEVLRLAAKIERTRPTDYIRNAALARASAVLREYLKKEGGLRG